MRKGVLSVAALAGVVVCAMVAAGAASVPAGTAPAATVTVKTVAVRAGSGWIETVGLANTRQRSVDGCAPNLATWAVLWKLTAKGQPSWKGGGFTLQDAAGGKFVQVCGVEERNEKGVWVTETIYAGPAEARRVTVAFGNWETVLTVEGAPEPMAVKQATTNKKGSKPKGAGRRGGVPW